eukprot:scaffold10328_cov112-Isochrysis_galbana.AAC.5
MSAFAPAPHESAGPKFSVRMAQLGLVTANFSTTVSKYEPPGEKTPKTRGRPAKTLVDEAAVAIMMASGALCTTAAAAALCADPKGPRKRRTPCASRSCMLEAVTALSE